MMARPDTLAAIEAGLWAQLGQAPLERGHGWRTGVLATTDGTRADARTIVLREVDAAGRSLIFYTDSRSPKVLQMEALPTGTLVLWSATLGWQLRLQVHLTVQTTGLAVSSRWAQLKLSPAAQDYLSPLPPGSPLDVPLPERGTRDWFAVVTAQVLAVDWLELHPDGHRRAAFDSQGSRWLVP
jgi:pyridoxamine 5'-phosphate oxidase